MACRRLALLVLILTASGCDGVVPPTVVQSSAVASSPIILVDRGTLGVSPSTALFTPGQSERYVALAEQIFTKDLAPVTWTVDNPSVASVAADGTLTAHTSGFTWLRAHGPDGSAAHPISVSAEPARLLTGKVWLESCSGGTLVGCSAIMKGAGSPSAAYLRYRMIQTHVVAEFWYGNGMNTSALVGVELAPGEFRFAEPALMTPVVSRGAGGCCSALSEITANIASEQLTGGGFKSSSSSTVLRYRIAAQ